MKNFRRLLIVFGPLMFVVNCTFAQSSKPESFKTFIQKFSKDSTFQRDRVQYPMIWKSYAGEETITHRETKETWKYYNVLKPSSDNNAVTVVYPTDRKPNEASVGETCRLGDCGYGAGLRFKRISNLWYCVARYWSSD